jgi:small subunit ribosomal protein S2
MDKLASKEIAAIKREMTRMTRNFNGISDMVGLPTAMFVVDTNHEKIAVAEGNRSGIATVGLVDTNSDPSQLKFPIPGNDDAVKSVRIIVEAVVAAIQDGLAQRDSRRNAPRTQPGEAPAAVPSSGEIDLSKVVLPAGVEAVVEGDAEAIAAKKKVVRARRAPVKAE